MYMGRKGAILMLAVMALWAVAPALACLKAAPCHSCCRAIMTDCGMATVGASRSCCQLHSASNAVPPARAVTPKPLGGPELGLAVAVLPDPGDLAAPQRNAASALPPRSQSGGSTILRI